MGALVRFSTSGWGGPQQVGTVVGKHGLGQFVVQDKGGKKWPIDGDKLEIINAKAYLPEGPGDAGELGVGHEISFKAANGLSPDQVGEIVGKDGFGNFLVELANGQVVPVNPNAVNHPQTAGT